MRFILSLITIFIIAAFIAVGSTLLAPTSATLSGTDLYMFFGGMTALMVAIVVLVKSNRGIEKLVGESSSARIAFGLDVVLFSLAIAGLISRFFVLNAGGFKGYLLLQYAALAIIAVIAGGCAILGLAVAAGVRSPVMLFALLRQMNKEDQEVSQSSGRSKE